jgi:hypothetical protein
LIVRFLASVQTLPPIGTAEQSHDRRCDSSPFAPGNAIKVYGASRIKTVDRSPLQTLRNGRRTRHDRNPNIGFHQLDQIVLGRNFVAMIDVEAVLVKRGAQSIGMFAKIP